LSRCSANVSVIALVTALCSCQGAASRRDAQLADELGQKHILQTSTEERLLLGFVVAREFTELRAPPNVFKLAGWHSSSGHTKLTMLAEEGKHVKRGEVVARFNFRHSRALDRIKDRIRRAEADQKKSAITQDKALSELLSQRHRRLLDVSTARLDTLKEAVISQRQLLLYRIAEKRALFEVEAITARGTAQRKTLQAERAYQLQRVTRERKNIGRYERQKERYSLRAPHAGVVRHAYYRRRRRKLKKGDGMPTGQPVILLAKDERLAVRCFIPEHRLHEVHLDQGVIVMGHSTAKYPGKVTHIERFPQELGFLLRDNDLPNARVKAFVVVADLAKGTKLAAGHEVRVRLLDDLDENDKPFKGSAP